MREKAILFSGYHPGVNDSLIQDFQAIGYTVYMPDSSWGLIQFYGDNHPFAHYDNVKIITFDEFLALPPMFLLAACVQQAADFKHLQEIREKKDIYVWLTATQDAVDFPEDYTDYLISHDIGFHRKSKAKYKMFYFNRPSIEIPVEDEIDFVHKFESGKINCFINELTTHPRHTMILDDLHKLRTALPQCRFYGYQAEHGNLPRNEVHKLISESMFTIGIKHWETWGQTINESMLLSTPTIHINKFSINMFHDYLITEDTAVIGDNVDEIVDKIQNMSLDQYINLCIQARTMSLLYTDAEPRRKQLEWLLSNGLNS